MAIPKGLAKVAGRLRTRRATLGKYTPRKKPRIYLPSQSATVRRF